LCVAQYPYPPLPLLIVGIGDGTDAAAAADDEVLELDPESLTVTVPFIHGWNEQWKVNVPAFEYVTVFVSPTLTAPVSNELSSAVAVCGCVPVFWNETVAPVLTVIAAGSNFHAVVGSPWPSTIFTTFSAPPAAFADAGGLDDAAPAPAPALVAAGDGFDEPP
jgi:hypothetical protein